ncbi:MAG: polyprenyl synthetase family protein [Candidatus Hydrothermarchaeota archaeon]
MYEKLLEDYTEMINKRLEKYFANLLDEARDYHPFIFDAYSHLQEYVLRKGKRLASCSTLLTYKGYTNEINEEILDVCVGIELYRHSILAHDDLVDRDILRRGGKAFHKIYEEYNERFGEGLAIFMGNIMYALSIQAIQNSGFKDELIKETLKLFARDYQRVNESQILDLLFEWKEPSKEEWYVMASKRAASLFHCTILTGAILGEAPREDILKLKDAASHIGYSFDIQDDIIGSFASKEEYGREPTGDIILGKKPLHTVYAFELSRGENLDKLRLKGDMTKEEIEEIKEIIKKSGALEKAKENSRTHAKKAVELIKGTSLSEETKEFFVGFIEYVAESLEWYK